MGTGAGASLGGGREIWIGSNWKHFAKPKSMEEERGGCCVSLVESGCHSWLDPSKYSGFICYGIITQHNIALVTFSRGPKAAWEFHTTY